MKLKSKIIFPFIILGGQIFFFPLSFQALIGGKQRDLEHTQSAVKVVKFKKNQKNFSELLEDLEQIIKKEKNTEKVENFFKEHFSKDSEFYKQVLSSMAVKEKEDLFSSLFFQALFNEKPEDSGHINSVIKALKFEDNEMLKFENNQEKPGEFLEFLEFFTQNLRSPKEAQDFHTDSELYKKIFEINFNPLPDASDKKKIENDSNLHNDSRFSHDILEKFFFDFDQIKEHTHSKLPGDLFFSTEFIKNNSQNLVKIITYSNQSKRKASISELTLPSAKGKKMLDWFEGKNFKQTVSFLCESNLEIPFDFFESLIQKIDALNSYEFVCVLNSIFYSKHQFSLNGFEKFTSKINKLTDYHFLTLICSLCSCHHTVPVEFFKSLDFSTIQSGIVLHKIFSNFCKSKQNIPLEVFDHIIQQVNYLDDVNFVNFLGALCSSDEEQPLLDTVQEINFSRITQVHEEQFKNFFNFFSCLDPKPLSNIFQNVIDTLDSNKLSYVKRLILASFFRKIKHKLPSSTFNKFCKDFFENLNFEEANKLNNLNFKNFVTEFCEYYEKKEILERFPLLSLRLKPEILEYLIFSKNLLDDIDTKPIPILALKDDFSDQDQIKELLINCLSSSEVANFANLTFGFIEKKKGKDYAKNFTKLVSSHVVTFQKKDQDALCVNLKQINPQRSTESVLALGSKQNFYDWCVLDHFYNDPPHLQDLKKTQRLLMHFIKIVHSNAKEEDYSHVNNIQNAMEYLNIVHNKGAFGLTQGYESLILKTFKDDMAGRLKKYLRQMLGYYFERTLDISRIRANLICPLAKMQKFSEEDRTAWKDGALLLGEFCHSLNWKSSGYNLFQGYGYDHASVHDAFERSMIPDPKKFDAKKMDDRARNAGYRDLVEDLLNLLMGENTMKISNKCAEPEKFLENLKRDLDQLIVNIYTLTRYKNDTTLHDGIKTQSVEEKRLAKDLEPYNPDRMVYRLWEILHEGHNGSLDLDNFPKARCAYGTLLSLRLAYAEMHGKTIIGLDFGECPAPNQ
ncbi:hypothetical protein P618_200873 [Holospora obtusa F1]|uniref:Uncharacterized protein n=1 Tax=Holospora obtusa F1 TaxID=1399147 RepID=W6TGH7_HOLOB|nr:hypothetical protein [Holospora obtusa]ETZ06975.1 hypothetical protein P618_200873 [Holospora obtusa F1]